MGSTDTQTPAFRIWIAEVAPWQPRSWRDLPAEAVALELATPKCFSAAEALAYVEGHNDAAIAHFGRRWAVAIPVAVRYEGEPRPGQRILPRRIGRPRG